MFVFDPVRHARIRFPEWTFHMGHLDDDETHVIYPQSHTAFINPTGISPLVAIAHLIGHLENGDHLTLGDGFTPEQCDEAALWAAWTVPADQAAQWPQWNNRIVTVLTERPSA